MFFEVNSAVVPRNQVFKLEELGCKVLGLDLEVLIADGHADAQEANVKDLALRRAQAVKKFLIEKGLEANRLYVEAKADKQPIQPSTTPEGRAKNRRVEILVVHIPQNAKRGVKECQPSWRTQMLAMTPGKAQALAKSLIRDGWVRPAAPLLLAIEAGRADLLAALLSRDAAIPLGKADRREIFNLAATNGDPDLIALLIRFGIQVHEMESPEQPLRLLACEFSHHKHKQLELAAQQILAWGAITNTRLVNLYPTPLECAVRDNNFILANLLLKAGADPNQPEGNVVRAANNDVLIKLLIDAGANPLGKNRDGLNLFHTYRFKNVAEISWLQSLGLNINEPSKDGSPLFFQLPTASIDILDAMVVAGAIVDTQDRKLLTAALKNYPALLWLINKGVKPGRDSLYVASLAVEGDKAIPVMEALRAAGADINVRNSQKRTALAVAIASNRIQLVRYLLDAGADTEAVEPGVSAIDFAKRLPIAKDSTSHCKPYYTCTPTPLPPEEYARRLAAKAAMVELLRNAEQKTAPVPGG